MRVTEAVKGRWEGVLSILAPELEQALSKQGRHVPCPVHGGKDGFRLYKDGTGGGYCNTCGPFVNGFSVLMWLRGWSFVEAAQAVEKVIGIAVDKKPKKTSSAPPERLLRAIARKAKAIKGTIAEEYLRNRGLTYIPTELKFIDSLGYYEDGKLLGNYAAMLAVVGIDEALTYHVTYLQDGAKAPVISPKKIMPPKKKITGSGIILFGTGEHVAITEGIETAIAVHEMTSLPVIAAISAHGMESIKLPGHVKCVSIFADNDRTYTGQAAAYALAKRLSIAGLSVGVNVAREIGTDYLDILTGRDEQKLLMEGMNHDRNGRRAPCKDFAMA